MGIMKGIGMLFDDKETKILKREKDFENFLENGDEFYITLPEIIEVVKDNSFNKLAATYAFGLVGYAATSNPETETKYREIKSVIKPVEKGLYIYNATMEGKDMKIPWENILNVTTRDRTPEKYDTCNTMEINFVDGRQIEITEFFSYGGLLFDFLNDHACGKVEDGWDSPIANNDDKMNNNVFCSNCGNKLNKKDKFCSGCGKQIEGE